MSPLSVPFVPFSIWHANVNGMGPRREELRAATANSAVIVFQDTRVRGDLPNAELWTRHWPEYSAYFFSHDHDAPGSVVLVHRSFHHSLEHRESRLRQRLLSVKVRNRDGRDVLVSSLYSAQGPLDRSLLDLAFSAPAAILVGDLNARHLELGCSSSNESGDVLLSFLEERPVVVFNDPNVATFHHTACSFSDCIDWALGSASIASQFGCSVGPDVGSDHLPLMVSSTRRSAAQTPLTPPVRWRTSRVTDWEPFRAVLVDRLRRIPWPAGESCSPEEIDRLAEDTERAISESADACLTRSVPRAHSGVLRLPWWLDSLVRERKRVRRLLCRHPQDSELRRSLSGLRSAIREGIPAYHRELAEHRAKQFASGPRDTHFWPAVKQWSRGVPPAQPPLGQDSQTAVTPRDRARMFGSHMESALGGLTSPTFDDAFFDETTQFVESHSFAESRSAPLDSDPTCVVTAWEVERELRRLHSGRCPGPDGISSDILKNSPIELALALAKLFSLSLEVGHFPTCWKRSFIRMLPKPGKRLTSPADFRPIALTSCVGKVLERIFARRLLHLCDRLQLLPAEQSAFRRNRCAQEQVVLVAQRAIQAMNGGLATAIVALDMEKAYDSVWHSGLIRQAIEIFPAATAKWISSFLLSRRAAVLEEGFLSDFFSVRAGVPQGSPLSPLLYLIFTRSLPLPRGDKEGATAYADDIALWACRQSPAACWARLEGSLHDIERWTKRWRMRLSAEKTQLSFVSRRPNWSAVDFGAPAFLGRSLEWSTSLKLLGVTLDRQLGLIPHCKAVASKVGPRLLELRRLMAANRTSIPRWVGLLLYRCLIRPAITFAAPILPLACPTAWKTLERVERRGIRAATRSRLSTPLPLLQERAAPQKPLVDEVRRQGASFLKRQLAASNARLLEAFRPEIRQRHDLVRWDLPLERLFRFLDDDERNAVRGWLRERGIRDIDYDPGRSSRGRTRTPIIWGISPLWRPSDD